MSVFIEIKSLKYGTGYGLDNGWFVVLGWYTHSQTNNLSIYLSHSCFMAFSSQTHTHKHTSLEEARKNLW